MKAIAGVLSLLLLLSAPSLLPAQAKDKDALEERVDRALAFLKTMQEKDGAWGMPGHGEKSHAITSLAVMAYLSAGHVPGEGPYTEVVDKGIRWVLANQQENGLFSGNFGFEMYQHGISTLMLAEVVGMTDTALAKQIKPKLEKAVALILRGQCQQPNAYRGGWRYQVISHDADMSVSGWQILALRAAKNVGCDVPGERIDQAVEFVLRCRDSASGGFGYTPVGHTTVPCTGTAILALEICGKDKHRARAALQAGSFMLKHPPRWGEMHFAYSIYYSSQAMFQLGNNYWNFYRPQLHKVLFDHQERNGSWLSNDGFGPAYATSMAVLALTVEYRLLPIYQRNEERKEME
ncbi:MAG: terpene cyclase/mutase family protein [Gemmataceae bacterium]|nr:terpene cyclase/mutase family protein [Gemmataceae bacterium]MCI0741376.1 terpene cyclase/mutase family protein [Gemmataceae bacterium]